MVQPTGTTCKKVLTSSYLNGGALSLAPPVSQQFQEEATLVLLRNAAGDVEVTGKVKCRGSKGRAEITSGWGKFAKAVGLRVGSEVQVELQHGSLPTLLFTVLVQGGGLTATEATRAKSQRARQSSADQQQQQQQQPAATLPAEPEQTGKAKWKRGSGPQPLPWRQPAAQQPAAQVPAAAAAGPLLSPGELPRAAASPEHCQQQQQLQQQQQQALGSPYSEAYEMPETSGSEGEAAAGSDAEDAEMAVAQVTRRLADDVAAAANASAGEAERPAKRRRSNGSGGGGSRAGSGSLPSGSAAALELNGSGSSEGQGLQQPKDLAAAAVQLLGRTVLVREGGAWKQACVAENHTRKLQKAQPGSLLLKHRDGEDARVVSVGEVAPVPKGLVGWTMRKAFPQGLFSGEVKEVITAEGKETLYNVIYYEDGDEEDLNLEELLPLLDARQPLGGAPQQAQQAQQAPAQPGGGGGRRGPGRPPRQQSQATLTGGRQQKQGAGAAPAAARADGDTPVGPLVPLEPTAEALQASQQAGGVYAAGGAGHERGVYAWAGLPGGKGKGTMRPVGPWLANPRTEIGTSIGRVGKIDRRHLPDRRLPEGASDRERGSSFVPGWLGVCTADDEPWSDDYRGQYSVVIYDSSAATKQAISCGATKFDTVEEAARLYDKVAVSYHGAKADTNYPLTPELWQSLGGIQGGTLVRRCIMLAARLLQVEQGVPDLAVATSAASKEDWDEWETCLVDDFLSRRPTEASIAALASKLKWFMQTLPEEALLPAYRGDPLQRLCSLCDSCCEPGHPKDHLAPATADCRVCAQHRKTVKGASHYHHGCASLTALVWELETSVISQDALAAFAEEAERAEAVGRRPSYQRAAAAADAAAQAEQAQLDEKLEVWREVCGEQPDEPARARRTGSAAARRARQRSPSTDLDQSDQTAAAAAARAVLQRRGPARDYPTAPGCQVVVIGGGVAGLKAACELQRGGVKVTLLEARDRLGGRIQTHTLCDGATRRPVDLGATFVCGTSREPPINPIFEYAVDELGLSLQAKKRDGPGATALYDREGRTVPEGVMLAAEERYADLMRRLFDRADEPGKHGSQKGESIETALEAIMAEMELDEQERTILDAYTADLYVATTAQLDLQGMTSMGYDGDHELVVGGYKQVVDALAEGRVDRQRAPQALRDVRLSTVVTGVRLLEGGVGVEVDVQDQAEPLRADAVLCTLPLGCLQKDTVRFDPPLPEHKQEAIQGLRMGTENRVAMLFDEVFWPEAPHFLRPVGGRYTYANLHALGVQGVLCAWVRPEAMAEYEEWSDEAVLADVERCLRELFPEGYCQPRAHHITRWGKDPFCYGAYSYVPPGSTKKYYEWMGHPVSGVPKVDASQQHVGGRNVQLETRLWFAGEAASKDDAYTVHGAYETGRAEALRIKKWWRQHHEAIQERRRLQQLNAAQLNVAVGGRAAAAAARVRLAAGGGAA